MKNAFIFAAVLAATIPAFADHHEPGGSGGPGGKPGMHEYPGPFGDKGLEHMKEKLKLSDEQQRKIKAVVEKNRPEAEALQAEMKALREKAKKHQLQLKEDVRAVLDNEQKERFDRMMARQMMRHKMHKGGRRAPGQERGPERGEAPGEPEGADGPDEGR